MFHRLADVRFGPGSLQRRWIVGSQLRRCRHRAPGFRDRTRLPAKRSPYNLMVRRLSPDGVGRPGSRDFFLARFNADGSLDTSFGTDGIVMTDVSGPWDEGQALAIQADGRIVVVGASDSIGDASDFAIVRYHPDGSLDTGFGEDGKVILDLGSPEDYGSDIAIQTDGKIVVSGRWRRSRTRSPACGWLS